MHKMLKRIFYKLLPSFIKEKAKRYFINQYRSKIVNKSVSEVFTFIYNKKIWGNKINYSGNGSKEKQTKEIIFQFPKLIKAFSFNSILDIPCGDFCWMKKVELNGIKYIGGDIVKEIISDNKDRYSTELISFQNLDIIEDKLPKVDLILCRDCFVHLSNDQVLKSLNNIKMSNSKYLLVTSFVGIKKNNDIITGEWRPINMQIDPFNLKPVYVIDEKTPTSEREYSGKSLLLIELKGN